MSVEGWDGSGDGVPLAAPGGGWTGDEGTGFPPTAGALPGLGVGLGGGDEGPVAAAPLPEPLLLGGGGAGFSTAGGLLPVLVGED
jgi:hypothetical protein